MSELKHTRLPDQSFWLGKRVFITGHSGFKGSWLSLWLHQLGAQVFGYSLPPHTSPNLFSILEIDSLCVSTYADVRQTHQLSEKLIDFKPEIIFHLAGQSIVSNGLEDPLMTYSTNVMGTVNLLEAARNLELTPAIVVITSDKCYSKPEQNTELGEEAKLGGCDPYSSSKAATELVVEAFRQSYFMNQSVATARAGNVIGGGDWSQDRLLPDLIRAYISNRSIQLRQPGAIRPWQHVLEALSGYLLLAEALFTEPLDFASAWNFGPDLEDCISVNQVVGQVQTLLKGSLLMESALSPFDEIRDLRLNHDKATRALHWKPVWSVSEALNKTISWYQAYFDQNHDLPALCLSQIKEYSQIK